MTFLKTLKEKTKSLTQKKKEDTATTTPPIGYRYKANPAQLNEAKRQLDDVINTLQAWHTLSK